MTMCLNACGTAKSPRKSAAMWPQRRWALGDDLGITPDDDRVGVMPGMAPSPHRRVAHDHEAGDVVHDRVHPPRPERRAVTALVPTRVGRRAVQHAVHGERQQRPHREPQVHAEAAEQHQQTEPQQPCRGWPARCAGASAPSSACAARRCDTTGPATDPTRLRDGIPRRSMSSHASRFMSPRTDRSWHARWDKIGELTMNLQRRVVTPVVGRLVVCGLIAVSCGEEGPPRLPRPRRTGRRSPTPPCRSSPTAAASSRCMAPD